MRLGHGQADGIGNALAERPGGDFDSWSMLRFGMSWGFAAEFLSNIVVSIESSVILAKAREGTDSKIL
jgi:hypothetical protein